MKCPACSQTLESVQVRNITLDVCKTGCAGIWFDQKELDQFDSSSEASGTDVLKGLHPQLRPLVTAEPRPCPKCEKYRMQRRYTCVKKSVEIDSCPGCSGIWLDTGELARIQDSWKTDDERNQAFETLYTNDLLPQFEEERKNIRETSTILQLEKVLRFIRPSYYLGKK